MSLRWYVIISYDATRAIPNDPNEPKTAETLEIITNQAVIAVSQDPNGSPANRLWKRTLTDGDLSLWIGGLVNK
jgi:PPE-repeat protein